MKPVFLSNEEDIDDHNRNNFSGVIDETVIPLGQKDRINIDIACS